MVIGSLAHSSARGQPRGRTPHACSRSLGLREEPAPLECRRERVQWRTGAEESMPHFTAFGDPGARAAGGRGGGVRCGGGQAPDTAVPRAAGGRARHLGRRKWHRTARKVRRGPTSHNRIMASGTRHVMQSLGDNTTRSCVSTIYFEMAEGRSMSATVRLRASRTAYGARYALSFPHELKRLREK